ncbi:MAG: hypothetical protein LBK99_12370 [Opitutaceae bacterium]|nr:hypothetical protein [Opitutaceae bacterium]
MERASRPAPESGTGILARERCLSAPAWHGHFLPIPADGAKRRLHASTPSYFPPPPIPVTPGAADGDGSGSGGGSGTRTAIETGMSAG